MNHWQQQDPGILRITNNIAQCPDSSKTSSLPRITFPIPPNPPKITQNSTKNSPPLQLVDALESVPNHISAPERESPRRACRGRRQSRRPRRGREQRRGQRRSSSFGARHSSRTLLASSSFSGTAEDSGHSSGGRLRRRCSRFFNGGIRRLRYQRTSNRLQWQRWTAFSPDPASERPDLATVAAERR